VKQAALVHILHGADHLSAWWRAPERRWVSDGTSCTNG
jgi:hypothetical protein